MGKCIASNDHFSPRWRLSTERQLRKLRVQLFGRRRPTREPRIVVVFGGQRTERKAPRYTRVSVSDRLKILRLASRRFSQRTIARKLRPRRDHKTIGYWLRRLAP